MAQLSEAIAHVRINDVPSVSFEKRRISNIMMYAPFIRERNDGEEPGSRGEFNR